QQPLSLQAPVGEDEEESLGDLIEDVTSLDPEESAMQALMETGLRERLEELPPREVRAPPPRCGRGDGQPLTLNEVGRRLGTTRERARQLESQALRRLRTPGNEEKLRPYAS